MKKELIISGSKHHKKAFIKDLEELGFKPMHPDTNEGIYEMYNISVGYEDDIVEKNKFLSSSDHPTHTLPQDWQRALEDCKKLLKLEKPRFKKGDWVFDTNNELFYLTGGQVEINNELTHDFIQVKSLYGVMYCYTTYSFRKATEEEVLEYFTKEAKNRGYDNAKYIKSLISGTKAEIGGTDSVYNIHGFHYHGALIWKDFKWADILEDKKYLDPSIEFTKQKGLYFNNRKNALNYCSDSNTYYVATTTYAVKFKGKIELIPIRKEDLEVGEFYYFTDDEFDEFKTQQNIGLFIGGNSHLYTYKDNLLPKKLIYNYKYIYSLKFIKERKN